MLKVLTIALLFLATPAYADEVTLEDFAWLAGQWIDQREDGTTIEINWAPPIGPVMIGTWQHLEGGDLIAYRNLRIIETGSSYYFRFEHYRKGNNFEIPITTQVRLLAVQDGKAAFELLGGDTSEAGVLTIEITAEGDLLSWHAPPEDGDDTPVINYRAKPAGN